MAKELTGKQKQVINKAFKKAMDTGADDFWLSVHKTKPLAQETADILKGAGFNANVQFARGIVGVPSGREFGVFVTDFDLENAKKICKNLGGKFDESGSCKLR